MHVLWDLIQQRQIAQGRRESGRINSRAGQAAREAEDAGDRLDRLTLITHAMWELMAERLGLSHESLLARIEEIDLRDGKKDGKLSQTGVSCRACSRISHRRHSNCLYCGAALGKSIF